jgi:hypothetical protein
VPTELVFRWEWQLRSSPEQLWPFVSDTDTFNRDTGLPSLVCVLGQPARDRGSSGTSVGVVSDRSNHHLEQP